jgi:molybdenum cofactor cytidylyltransferase
MGPAVSAVVPAAGRAERFGGGKLIAVIDGEPLLTHTLRSLLDGGVQSAVLVVSAARDFGGVALLDDPRVKVVVNPASERGMFSSIQVGITALVPAPTWLVLPADMPFVLPATVAAVAAHARRTGAVVVPIHAGRRGHPLALPGALCEPLLGADPASNLKAALAALDWPLVELPVADPGVLRDVDVRSDLSR